METNQSDMAARPDDADRLRRRFDLDGRRFEFLGAPLDPLDMDETVRIIDAAMAERICLKHMAVNVSKLVHMQGDDTLRGDVAGSDLITMDGMGVVWGARLAGHRVPGRVTGIGLMERVLELCADRGYRPYILGARADILQRAVANISSQYPSLSVAGYRDGYFSTDQEAGVVETIRSSGADCLFVAISSPVKERFTQQYRTALGVSFLMGVGGSIDVMAGAVRRAPEWMQHWGLEWLYRLLQEPRRLWKRYLVTNARYAWLLIKLLSTRHFADARPRTSR